MSKQKIKKGEPLYIDHFENGGYRPNTGKPKKDPQEISHRFWVCIPAPIGRSMHEFLTKSGVKRSHLISKLLNAFLNSETAKRLIEENQSKKESVE